MSETVQVAAFVLVAGAIATIAKLLWNHVEHCKEVHAKLAEIGSDVKRVKEDIGDHKSGIRGDIRDHNTKLFKLDARVEALGRGENQR